MDLLQLLLHIMISPLGVFAYKESKVNCCTRPRYSPPYTVDYSNVSCRNYFGSKFKISDVASGCSAFDTLLEQDALW